MEEGDGVGGGGTNVGKLFFDFCCFKCEQLGLEVIEHDDVCACACSSKSVGCAAALHLVKKVVEVMMTTMMMMAQLHPTSIFTLKPHRARAAVTAEGMLPVAAMWLSFSMTCTSSWRETKPQSKRLAQRQRKLQLLHHGAEVHAMRVNTTNEQAVPAPACA